MNTSEIENDLRHAPRPKAPTGLRERLIAAGLAAMKRNTQASMTTRVQGTWLSRWWPALAPTAVSLACAAVFTMQQMEISELKNAIQTQPETSQATGAQTAPMLQAANPSALDAPSSVEEGEIARLRSLTGKLSAEVSRLEQMREENDKLRAQLATTSAGAFTPEETKALEEARAKAMSIKCANTMKQLGLAARMWALDNGEMSPANLGSMNNELGSPTMLVCPADTARQPATDWRSFTPANCSYEYLAPSTLNLSAEPNRVMFRCPIHGNIGLCDGSVQMGVAKAHPEWLVQREGKLYFQVSDAAPPSGDNPSQ